jgi:hypothetical protein
MCRGLILYFHSLFEQIDAHVHQYNYCQAQTLDHSYAYNIPTAGRHQHNTHTHIHLHTHTHARTHTCPPRINFHSQFREKMSTHSSCMIPPPNCHAHTRVHTLDRAHIQHSSLRVDHFHFCVHVHTQPHSGSLTYSAFESPQLPGCRLRQHVQGSQLWREVQRRSLRYECPPLFVNSDVFVNIVMPALTLANGNDGSTPVCKQQYAVVNIALCCA